MPSHARRACEPVLLAVASTLVLAACGGGGGGDTGAGGDGPPPPAAWTSRKVADVAVSGLTTPWVAASPDDTGRVHLAFFARNPAPADGSRPYDVTYRTLDLGAAAAAEPEVVAAVDNTSGLALAVDAAGRPVAVYQGGEQRACGAERQSDAMVSFPVLPSGWEEQTAAIGIVERNPVFRDGFAGADLAAAADSRGRVHVAYQFRYEGCDAMNFRYADLGYAMVDPGSGAVPAEEIVEGNDYTATNEQNRVGQHVSIAVDGGDEPVAFYYAELSDGSRGLRAARRMAGAWAPEWVDEGCEILATSAAVSPDGAVAVAYAVGACDDPQADDHALRYAAPTASGWAVQTVDAASWCGEHCSLAFDAAGSPLVAYRDIQTFSGYPRKDLKLARLVGGSWARETVSSAGDAGRFNRLWVDGEGRAVIVTYVSSESPAPPEHAVYLFRKALSP